MAEIGVSSNRTVKRGKIHRGVRLRIMQKMPQMRRFCLKSDTSPSSALGQTCLLTHKTNLFQGRSQRSLERRCPSGPYLCFLNPARKGIKLTAR
jgi:hypothetical protein